MFLCALRSMDLTDAVYALDELAAGRPPDEARTARGLQALDALLSERNDADLHEAAALLEVFVATRSLGTGEESLARTRQLADAVRRAMGP